MDVHHEIVIVNTPIGIRFWYSVANKNGYVPFHWHSSIEIVCVLHGQLTFNINGHSFIISDNQFIMVPSGVVHDVANTPNQSYVIQIPLKAVSDYVEHPELVTFRNAQLDDPAYQKAVELIKDLGRLYRTRPADYRFDGQIAFVKLMKIMFTKLNDPDHQVPNDNQVKQIIIYINSHYQEKITVKGLAHHFGYNPDYLSRRFKGQVGISIVDYMYVVRLNKLYDDLLHTNTEIRQLFIKNGLHNPRTARRIFQQMFGKLPNELRQEK